MLITDRYSELPGGDPVPATLVSLRRVHDNSLIAQETTDADGFVTFQANGSPGPVYRSATINGQTRKRYGAVGDQIGTWYELEWETYMSIMTSGVIRGLAGELAVTAGTGMTVKVAAGGALLDGGLFYKAYVEDILPVPPNSSGLGRKDLVVIRFTISGALRGKCELGYVTGTPAATPVAPAPIATATEVDLILAVITVANGAAAITSGNVQDMRDTAQAFIRPGSITKEMLANNAVDGSKLADGSVSWAKLATGLVGTGANTVAAGTHTHAAAGITDLTETTQDMIATFLKAGTGISLTYDDAGNLLTIAATGGGGTGGGTHYWKDGNFAAADAVAGTWTLGSASVSVPAGTYFVTTETTFTARNGGDNGSFTCALTGNGTPVAPDNSSRIFQTVGGVPRAIPLSGRRRVTPTVTTTYTANCVVTHTSGNYTDMRDGYVGIVLEKE